MPPLFTGVGVALVTLFDDDARLDTAATADLAVQHGIGAGDVCQRQHRIRLRIQRRRDFTR